jgi:acetyltransferase
MPAFPCYSSTGKRQGRKRSSAGLTAHPYPSQLEGKLQLRDGSTVLVRPIKPEDDALETRFVDGLSAQSRYQRFLNQMAHLPPQLLNRFTHIDYEREMALVALAPEGGEFIGVARYAPNAGGTSAEFALSVSDAWQGRGLGHALLQKLCACARTAGYAALDGLILSGNSDMLELVSQLGFVRTGHDGDTVTVMRKL